MLDDALPVLLSLAAALLFAVGAQFQNIGLDYMDSRAGAAVSICSSAVFFWLAAPFFLKLDYWLHPAVLIFVAIGLFRPALSANLALAGMRYLGPTVSSTLSSTSPVFGTLLGIFWLGEVLTWPIAIGTGGIVGAVMLLAKRGGRQARSWPLWALGLPVAAAAIRALGHDLSKIGMVYIPSPYFAGLVGFTVSGLITIVVHLGRRDRAPIPWRTRGPFWFIAAGATFSVALICLNTALQRGQIIAVVPVVAASPVFTLLLSYAVSRAERLSGRIVAAVFVVVPAVMLIAVSR
ncbi:MAG: EamA family transporter [Alphaproteobacteria bacterium]|nr:EamA family transporter [Alphaproteobacteria bacterium]